MTTLIDPLAVVRGTRSLFKLLSVEQVEQIVRLEVDEDLERRVSYLASRANEGELTNAEEAEYMGYVEANSVIALLRAAARHQAASSS
ncbi:MAG TPA: hypothetical protein VM452_11575 [Caulifigura sp.]|jgi:hypothetical protein|nr:hypothetical protein [Caulifigura sp.]